MFRGEYALKKHDLIKVVVKSVPNLMWKVNCLVVSNKLNVYHKCGQSLHE